MSLDEDELSQALNNFHVTEPSNPFQQEMDQATMQTLLSAAVRAATEQTKREFQTQLESLTNRLSTLEAPVSAQCCMSGQKSKIFFVHLKKKKYGKRFSML